MSVSEPIKILHVVGGMNRGGVEIWLMHVLRHIDRERFQMDFLVHTAQPCAYNDEIYALGSRIFPCPFSKQPFRYARSLRKILQTTGPYDVMHSHVNHYSGWVLRQAAVCQIPLRIAHSHTNTRKIEKNVSLLRNAYLNLMRYLIHAHSTCKLGISRLSAESLFGKDWQADSRTQVLYYGIDFSEFKQPAEPAVIRREFHLPPNALIIGHVGRFVEPKNHVFLLDIIAEVGKWNPNIYFLLVGDGPLRQSIEQKAFALGVLDHVCFTGSRRDVPRLMRGAMNVFVFPSSYEGLGIVLLEAQASGLPCVFSDVVPEEVDQVKPLINRMSLNQSASAWAESIVKLSQAPPPIEQSAALQIIEKSLFNIYTSVNRLEAIYEGNSCS